MVHRLCRCRRRAAKPAAAPPRRAQPGGRGRGTWNKHLVHRLRRVRDGRGHAPTASAARGLRHATAAACRLAAANERVQGAGPGLLVLAPRRCRAACGVACLGAQHGALYKRRRKQACSGVCRQVLNRCSSCTCNKSTVALLCRAREKPCLRCMSFCHVPAPPLPSIAHGQVINRILQLAGSLAAPLARKALPVTASSARPLPAAARRTCGAPQSACAPWPAGSGARPPCTASQLSACSELLQASPGARYAVAAGWQGRLCARQARGSLLPLPPAPARALPPPTPLNVPPNAAGLPAGMAPPPGSDDDVWFEVCPAPSIQEGLQLRAAAGTGTPLHPHWLLRLPPPFLLGCHP